MINKYVSRAALAAAAVLVGAQLIPYGRAHRNPPVGEEPSWSDPTVRALAVRACFDCHSNETRWPWYSHVAPASWLVQRDVDEGRRKVNFSEWGRPQQEAKESAEEIAKGTMPPSLYLPLHPEARLSPAERDHLARGLTATLGAVEGEQGEDEADD